MATEILQQKQIMDKEISDTKAYIEQLEATLKEQQHKNKLKETRKEYEKQSNRYKIISDSLMERNSIRAEMRDSTRRYRNSRDDRNSFKPSNNRDSYEPPIAKSEQIDEDLEFEHQLILHRKKQLAQNAEQMDRIYNVVQDMAKEVQNQGEMVDIIDENILMAQKNVESTNDELDEAKSHQKKSRKKYIILIVVLIFIVVIVIGLSFMWKK